MHFLAGRILYMVLATVGLVHAQTRLDLSSRDNSTVSIDLQWPDDVYEYITQVKIGTPGQLMPVRIEVGNIITYQTLIPATNATGCANNTDNNNQCLFGSFNQTSSSTFQFFPSQNFIGDGAAFTDIIELNGVSLPNYNMDLLYNMAPENIEDYSIQYFENIEPSLPIVYLSDVYTFDNGATMPANIVDIMVSEGHIVTPAFSLWLQDEEGNYEGGLLLGAIDKARYEGDLVGLETYGISSLGVLQSSPDEYDSTEAMGIAMTSLSASSPTGTDEIWVQSPLLVRIKLGDDLWLSPYLAAQIRNITGAFVKSDETGQYEYTVIPCSMKDSEGYFTFGFGGPEALKVNVTMRSLVVQPSRKLRELFSSFGDDMCRFGVSEAKGSNVGFLSSHLLRSVYTVVDLYNKKIAMAPIRLNNTKGNESNIVMFDGYGSPIPSATMAPGQPSSINTSVLPGPSQPTPFQASRGFKIISAATLPPSSSPTSTPPTDDSISNEWTRYIKVMIGVGVSIAVTLLVVGAFYILRRWTKCCNLATRSFCKQQVHGEILDAQGNPIDVVQIQPQYTCGGIQPAELSGVREPFELYGVEIYPELPGDHKFPKKAEVKIEVENA
ncbi:acid protease [Jackrogersella minutella]|nr:acid protease [Jackrogersella minutella]